MFSTKAPAIPTSFRPCLWLIVLSLVMTPALVSAQGTNEGSGQSDEDPPPVWYVPDSESQVQNAVQFFVCRTPFGDAQGAIFCAGEMSLGENRSVHVTDAPTTFTFVLETHETVTFNTKGDLDTYGELRDASGRKLAAAGGAGEGNFRITRTLAPGRYWLDVSGAAGVQGSAVLRSARTRPRGWDGGGFTTDLTGDVGNHCGRAALISSTATVEGAFDRLDDVDVFAVEVQRAGDLLIDFAGAALFELKAADCKTSLGLANSSLGATLATLEEGTYFLYVSRPQESPGDYRLRLELR